MHLHGPVGLLIQDLNACGCTLHEDFNITAPDEQDINLWRIPWQHLKTAIMGIAVRDRNRCIQQNRTFCGTFQELDQPILHNTIHKLGVKEQKIFAHIATGGFWNESQLHEIQSSEGKCTHCGKQAADSNHVLWECEVINTHRKINKLSNLKHQHLPNSIKCGLPPAMTKRLHGCLWENGPQQQDINDKDTEEAIGYSTSRWRRNFAESSSKTLSQIFSDHHIDNEAINARQAFQLLKQAQSEPIMPLPDACQVYAPDNTNGYTDGSWLHPLKQFLGIGGAGVWWPNKALTRTEGGPQFKRLSKGEYDMAEFIVEKLHTKIGGFFGSSTRTELAAGIIAVCAHGPVHIGSDSEVFVNGANQILKWLNTGTNVLKPWNFSK